MNIQLKPMILVFENHGKTWSKTVKDLHGNVIHTSSGGLLLPEYNNKEYFDDWEAQIRKLPVFNIVDCERFV
jgi:hypothetical protein